MGICKDLCWRYSSENQSARQDPYANGLKRCRSCDVFMKWEKAHCPCCGSRLRVKPREPEQKRKFNERQNVKFIEAVEEEGGEN